MPKKKPRPPIPCASCGKEFVPPSHKVKYCSLGCSLGGLQAAIERQRLRRKMATAERHAAKMNKPTG